MSSDDSLTQQLRKSLKGHIENVRNEVVNLVSKIHRAGIQPNTEFVDQVSRTKAAIASLQAFFSPNTRSDLLAGLYDVVVKLESNPNDFRLIRDLTEVGPHLQRLEGGPNEGFILEDQ